MEGQLVGRLVETVAEPLSRFPVSGSEVVVEFVSSLFWGLLLGPPREDPCFTQSRQSVLSGDSRLL